MPHSSPQDISLLKVELARLRQREAELERQLAQAQAPDGEYHPQESELSLALFSEMANDGISVTDEQGFIIAWNPAAERITGISQKDALGKRAWDLRMEVTSPAVFSNETFNRLKAEFHEFFTTGRSPWRGQVVEHKNLRKDGSWYITQTVIFPIPGERGFKMGAIFRDITGVRIYEEELEQRVAERTAELRQANQLLEKSERKYRTLVESINDLVSELDPQGNFLYANVEFKEVLGYTPEELVGTNMKAICHPEEGEEGLQKLIDAVQQGGQPQGTWRFRHKNGEWRCFESRAALSEPAPGKKTVVVISRDITERLEAGKKLRESEAALSRAQRVAKLGSWKWSVQTGLLEISDELYRILDIRPGQESLTSLIPRFRSRFRPEDVWIFDEIRRRMMEEKWFSPFEICLVWPDGSLHWVYAEAGDVILDALGNVDAMTGIVQDITERKRTEDALRENRRLIQAVFDYSPSVIYVKDLQGHLVLTNRELEKLVGLTQEELLFKTSFEFQSQEAAEEHFQHDQQVMRTRIPGQFEEKADTPTGRRVFLSVKFPLFDDQGSVSGVGGIATDITERRAMEVALREADLKYKIVADNTFDWEFWVNPRGKFEYISPSCERITGYPVNAFLVDPGLDARIIHPEDRAAYQTHKAQVLREHKGGHLNFRILRANGEERWVEHSCQAVFDPAGAFMGERGSNHDFTERKQAEGLLKELEVLRGINQLRDELVSNVSHELRTPLGLILVMVTALRKDDLSLSPEMRQEFLKDIEEETLGLQGMVSHLLDASLLHSGRMKLRLAPTDLGKLITRLAGQVRLQPTRHTITTRLPDTPVIAQVDAQRIEQVLRNLLDNAIKYSPAGTRITITLRQARAETRVQVRDQGQGLPQAEYERIFDRFYRVVNHLDPVIPGLGLGLPISRGIIEALGGRLWGERLPKGGSLFTFTLPRTPDVPKPFPGDPFDDSH